MKRFRAVFFVLVFLMWTSGCEGVFNPIPKNTVLEKEITREQQDIVDIEGVLSQETARELSLHAINKYFDRQLMSDEVIYEFATINRKTMADWLQRIAAFKARNEGAAPAPVSTTDTASELDMEGLDGGLYRIMIATNNEETEEFEIVMNAKNGDIYRVFRTAAYSRKQHASELELAKRFIKEKGVYSLSELKEWKDPVIQGRQTEVFYTGKDDEVIKYSVIVSRLDGQIIGFSKDVMARISYYSIM